MQDFRPIAYFMTYAMLLNNCMARFIDEHEKYFTYDEQTKSFIMAKQLSENQIKKSFEEYLSLEIQRIFFLVGKRYQNQTRKYFFICNVGSKLRPSYFLTESDIRIDVQKFEKVWDKIFIKWFKRGHDNNFVFCQHNEIEDRQWIPILIEKFGKSRVKDLNLIVKAGMKECIEITWTSLELSNETKKLAKKECLQWIDKQME